MACSPAMMVVLVFALTSLAMATAAHRPPSFVVQVEDGQMDEVVAAYKARGFEIQSINTEYSFLKVAQPMAVTSSISSGSGRAMPAWLPPYAWAQARALSPGDSPAGPIYPKGAEAAAAAAATLSPAGEPELTAPTWGAGPSAEAGAPGSATVASLPAGASSPSIASTIAALSEVQGVENVEVNVPARLLVRRGPAAAAAAAAASTSAARSLLQASPAAGVCASAKPKNGPDTDTGKFGESAPYGVRMVQADHPEMVSVSKEHAGKIIYCVIDTGLDRRNIEFEGSPLIGGCTPHQVRPNGNATKCIYNWYDDTMGHGTHTSGTIGAMRNGKGIYGVSAEAAQIYHVNAFGDSDTFDFSDIVMSWDDCIAELEVRKVATGQPDMKMIISMSLGAGGDLAVVRSAVKKIVSERNDILFISAAGNGGSSATAYPAGYPEVVSIAAVDWNMNKAHFSQYNSDVEWAAPGVQVLSTIPTQNAATSAYNLRPRITMTPSGEVFAPGSGPMILPGGATGKAVTGELVDCGLGLQTCRGAAGKICLMQRGEATFCSKVNNCLEGGGVAAIIYDKDAAADKCAPVSGATLHDPSCDEPRGGWPIVLTTSVTQGKALKEMLRQTDISMTLDTSVGTDVPALDFMSGTSMATPNAAGVAGLVWSAHTSCSASELRRAISATAIDKGPPGRDEQYGFGVIQSLAAHQYLKANPCSGKNVRFDRVTPSQGQQQFAESGEASGPFELSIPPAVSAPVNERVMLPFVLGPRTPCPGSGESVIQAVTIGRRLRHCLPALEYVALKSARASVREACSSSQNKGTFSFVAARTRAAPGDCYELEVTSTDQQVHHSIIMFTD